MTQKITVLKVDQTTAPKGYKVIDLAYKASDGKTKAMKILDFVQRDVYNVLVDSAPGDVLDVTFVKNDKGYWNFGTVARTDEKGSVEVEQKTKGGGNWETSEERAKRQVMIVRQSSIANAVAYFASQKEKIGVGEIIQVAKAFEEYVLS